jgi:hypothetical protein
MAKQIDKDLFKTMRARGLRKKTAKRLAVPGTLGSAKGEELLGQLRMLVEDLEERAGTREHAERHPLQHWAKDAA